MTTTATCPICGQPANRAWRHNSIDGTYQEGCIARFHDAYPDDWHRRQSADFKRKGVTRV